ATRQAPAVVAVVGEQVVVGLENGGGAGADRLLADGEVEEPADAALGVVLGGQLLETPHPLHGAEDVPEVEIGDGGGDDVGGGHALGGECEDHSVLFSYCQTTYVICRTQTITNAHP